MESVKVLKYNTRDKNTINIDNIYYIHLIHKQKINNMANNSDKYFLNLPN